MKCLATITVIGRDRTGVIARVTDFLFHCGANIEALEEQVTRGRFSMTLQASWASGKLRQTELAKGLTELGRQLQMDITLNVAEANRPQRFALMVSKQANCAEVLLESWRKGQLKAEPVMMLSNHPVLEPMARKYRLPFECVRWLEPEPAEAQALRLLEEHKVDFVVLARFMRILSPNFVWRYKNKIINIHPSLLPSFPGAQAYRQAYELGVKVIGVTAHFVSMHLDEGPIIAQDCFAVKESMTLKQIVSAGQELEADVLLKAVKLYLKNRLDVYWGKVREI